MAPKPRLAAMFVAEVVPEGAHGIEALLVERCATVAVGGSGTITIRKYLQQHGQGSGCAEKRSAPPGCQALPKELTKFASDR